MARGRLGLPGRTVAGEAEEHVVEAGLTQGEAIGFEVLSGLLRPIRRYIRYHASSAEAVMSAAVRG